MSAARISLPDLHFGPGERWAWTGALAYTLINVLLRASAAHIDPWFGSLLRLLPLVVVASVVLARQGSPELRPHNSAFIGWIAIVGLLVGGALSYVIGNGFYFLALADGGLAIASNATQGGNVWAGVILGFLMLRERPRNQQVVGASIIAGGLALIALSQLNNPSHLWILGLLLALVAGCSYAMNNIFTRMVQRNQSALFAVLAVAALGGLIPLLGIFLFRLAFDPAALFTGLRLYDVIVVLIAGGLNMVARTSVAQAVRYSSVATANSIGSAQIVFSVMASVLIFGEAVPLLMLLGVAAILAGILLCQAVAKVISPDEAEVEAV
jgi:drug/metabolite transporter (DMT)-like permease